MAIMPREVVDTNRVTLIKLRKAMSFQVGRTALETFDVETMSDMMGNQIVRASFDVLADKIHEDRTTVYFSYKTPSTWFQQLKKEKAPKFLKDKYPVKYNTHNLKRTAIFKRYAEYPKANVAIPKENNTFFLETLGGLEVIRDEVTN